MKFLIYLGHPAHYHLFKHVIQKVREDGHFIKILIKKKDVLERLLDNDGLEYANILPQGRGDAKASIAWGLAVRDWRMLRAVRTWRPDLMLGTSAEITHVGKFMRIPSAVVNEDDFDAVPLFAKLAYPFATHILTPVSCRVGRWASRRIAYDGYHELAYLHPRYFTPDPTIIRRLLPEGGRYFILRFARLKAHHDAGKSGIGAELAARLIDVLTPHGAVFISSERTLEPDFEKYRFPLDPADMHHALHFAEMVVADSQTMTAEAAVLGTPALRFNDFVGKLGYLEELEHKYGLTYGIRTAETGKLLDKIEELLRMPDLKEEWQKRRHIMLREKIDVTQFMVRFMESYPASIDVMRCDPSALGRFK